MKSIIYVYSYIYFRRPYAVAEFHFLMTLAMDSEMHFISHCMPSHSPQMRCAVLEAGIKGRDKHLHFTVSVGCNCLSLPLIPASLHSLVNVAISHLPLTHWGRDKITANFPTAFSNGFPWIKMHEFRLIFHWSLLPKVQLIIFKHCWK